MKEKQILSSLILLFFLIACTNKTPAETANAALENDAANAGPALVTDTFAMGKIIENVVCKTDTSHSYALYIPAKVNNEALPVVYFFDPHADGTLPLNKYKKLADDYGFILIGSNNSKNGNDLPLTESIWSMLFTDTQKRLHIDTNRIYTCGFSGGAKVASYIALHHNEVKGVIANGASLPDGTPAGNFNFSFTAIAGQGDMNMTDLVAINNDFDKTQTRHRIIFFDGKHEWAPETTMDIAFAGLQLDAMYQKMIPKNDSFISNYIYDGKKKVDGYYHSNKLIKAADACRLCINMLDGLTNEVSWFMEKEKSISTNAVFQKQIQEQQNLFAKEQNIKAVYMQQFQQGNKNYWLTTINNLNIKAKSQTPESTMYQRLLAYLSLAFYSFSNSYITNNQNNEAAYFVDLYKMADPANSEAWYFSAILDARNNNAALTKTDLLKAIACGFTDKNRMMQQTEFQNISSQINLGKMESKMKSGK